MLRNLNDSWYLPENCNKDRTLKNELYRDYTMRGPKTERAEAASSFPLTWIIRYLIGRPLSILK